MSAEDAEPTKQMQIDPDDEEMIQKARQGRREYRKFLEISKILKIPKSSSHKRFFFTYFKIHKPSVFKPPPKTSSTNRR
jgi:hypothetical protein